MAPFPGPHTPHRIVPRRVGKHAMRTLILCAAFSLPLYSSGLCRSGSTHRVYTNRSPRQLLTVLTSNSSSLMYIRLATFSPLAPSPPHPLSSPFLLSRPHHSRICGHLQYLFCCLTFSPLHTQSVLCWIFAHAIAPIVPYRLRLLSLRALLFTIFTYVEY